VVACGRGCGGKDAGESGGGRGWLLGRRRVRERKTERR